MVLGVKAIYSFLFCFFVCLVILPLVYEYLKKSKAKQTILEYVDMHKQKNGTPTMGGVAIIGAVCVSAIVLLDGYVKPVLILLCVVVLNFLIGLIDDSVKIKGKKNEGLKPWQKLVFQFLIFGLFGVYLYKNNLTKLIIPFTNKCVDIGFWVIVLSIFFGIFFTNCTNLADGLDGLECFIALPVSCCFGAILLLISQCSIFEMSINSNLLSNSAYLLTMLGGAVFCFLFYNGHPAKIFMGDTGSLSIGALLVSVSLLTGTEIYLLILGVLFVATGVSVLLQVGYFKLTHKRIFLMAPLHHHFEKKGYHESKISICYFIISLVVGLVAILLELV